MTAARKGEEESALMLSAINFAWAVSAPTCVKCSPNCLSCTFLARANASGSIMIGYPLALRAIPEPEVEKPRVKI
jgi:hypothetical protein